MFELIERAKHSNLHKQKETLSNPTSQSNPAFFVQTGQMLGHSPEDLLASVNTFVSPPKEHKNLLANSINTIY
jgi:hypothetical protein